MTECDEDCDQNGVPDDCEPDPCAGDVVKTCAVDVEDLILVIFW